jgi:hypothetical protein
MQLKSNALNQSASLHDIQLSFSRVYDRIFDVMVFHAVIINVFAFFGHLFCSYMCSVYLFWLFLLS